MVWSCAAYGIPVALGKHYTGYQLKRGRPRRDTIMDISQMNATWDDICETAMMSDVCQTDRHHMSDRRQTSDKCIA